MFVEKKLYTCFYLQIDWINLGHDLLTFWADPILVFYLDAAYSVLIGELYELLEIHPEEQMNTLFARLATCRTVLFCLVVVMLLAA